jgi:hypothetical protein
MKLSDRARRGATTATGWLGEKMDFLNILELKS